MGELSDLLEDLPSLQLLLAPPLVSLEAPPVLLEDTERGTPRPTPAMAPVVLLEESLPTPAPRGVSTPLCAPLSPSRTATRPLSPGPGRWPGLFVTPSLT